MADTLSLVPDSVLERDPRRDASTWQFQRGRDKRWSWRRIVSGVPALESVSSFSTYSDCVRDAMSAGYKPLARSPNLVALSLARPIEEGVAGCHLARVPRSRSAVLKKRVANPTIEKLFGKTGGSAKTRKRPAAPARVDHLASAPAARGRDTAAHTHAKSRLDRR